jgi:hypothetical protein
MKRREQLWDRPLSEREVRFLLGGFAALPTPHWRDLPEPEGTRIFEWFLGDAGPVFERHREFLHAEAKRLGISPVYRHATGDYFYAEPMPPGGNRLVTDAREDAVTAREQSHGE